MGTVIFMDTNDTVFFNGLVGPAANVADGSLLISGFGAGSFGTPINAYAGGNDMVLLKLNANGGLIWNTFFGAAGNDAGGEAILRPDGLIVYLGVASGVLTGNVGVSASGSTGGATMGTALVLDSNGAVSFNGLLGPAGNTAEFRSGVAATNGIIVAGQAGADFGTPVNAHSALGDDWYIQQLTYDTTPNLGFGTFLGAGGADVSQAAVALSTNEILVAGRSFNTTGTPLNAHSGNADITVMKLDASGNRIFHTYFGQAGVDRAFGAAELTNGSLVVAGHSDASWGSPATPFIGGIDFAVARLTNTGALAENRFYGSSGTDQAFSLAATCDGGIVMAGDASGQFSGLGVPVNAYTAGGEDGVILKLAPGSF